MKTKTTTQTKTGSAKVVQPSPPSVPSKSTGDNSSGSDSELDFELPSARAATVKSNANAKKALASSLQLAQRSQRSVNFDESDSSSSSPPSDSESEGEGRNIVGSIAKGLSDIKHSRNSKKIDFASDSEEDDDGPITKLTVNKSFQKQYEKVKEAHSLSKEHQRAMESLQAQLKEQAKREKRARKRARQLAAVKAGEEYVDSDSEEDEESDYSTEDEDGTLLTPKRDLQILETLQKIRKRDRSIYSKDVKFYDEEDSEAETEADPSKTQELQKKQRRLTLGRLIAQKAKEGLSKGDLSDSDFDPNDENRPMTYVEEQNALRQALIDSAKTNIEDDDESDGDDFFGKAKKVYSPDDEATAATRASLEDALVTKDFGSGDGEIDSKKASRARGLEKLKKRAQAQAGDQSGALQERADRFLQAYVMGGLWKSDADRKLLPSPTVVLGKERGKLLKAQLKASKRSKGEDVESDLESSSESDGNASKSEGETDTSSTENFDFDEDDQYLDETDAFEAKYNFRFEEPGATEIVSYPRPHMITEGSVRKTSSRTDSRKAQRQRKKERLQAEKQRKLEEYRRLKSLQRKAVAERLAVIAQVAGLKVNARTGAVEDAKGDNEDLYNDDDMEKPTFDDDDDEAAIAKLKEKMFGKTKGGIASLTMKDLTDSFDEKEHDRRMAEIFNETFYNELDEEDSEALAEEEAKLKAEAAELASEYKREGKESSDSSDEEDEEEEESDEDNDNEDDENAKKEKEELKKLRAERKQVQEKIKQREKASKDFIAKSLQQMIKAEDADEEAEFWLKKETERLMKIHGHELPPDARKLPRKELLRQLMEIELAKAEAEAEQSAGLGGLRFEYEQVPASSFGMDLEDILNLTDKELNMRVGMKKLAPYREDAEWIASRTWDTINRKPSGMGEKRPSRDYDQDDEDGSRARMRWVDQGRSKHVKHGYRPDPYAHLKPKTQQHNAFTKRYRKQDDAKPQGKKVTF